MVTMSEIISDLENLETEYEKEIQFLTDELEKKRNMETFVYKLNFGSPEEREMLGELLEALSFYKNI